MPEVAPGYCDCGRPSANLRDKADNRCDTCKRNERKFAEMERIAQEKRDRAKIDIRLKRNGLSKPVASASPKLMAYLKRYAPIRDGFLKKNKRCAVYPEKKSTQVHHKEGRSYLTFHDQWAKDNDIPRLLDVRFFLAVSQDGHNWIEANPNAAKEKGWSLNRL